eukprot:CAMPEP_0197617516 /NCGR_PEP_ID=MMETSP1326-20131121/61076_1 /TAXON_ID=1155430 /ORGANISM="Genus nov. species nov., Strain RCC2288" /LENGTH=348 /DNA_ID=CAMNT_0043186411 /DNA_START=43 /DNA_END=1089 /DNA_ORIENTATION=-
MAPPAADEELGGLTGGAGKKRYTPLSSATAALSVVLVCAVVLGVAVSSGALRANTNFNAELLPSAKVSAAAAAAAAGAQADAHAAAANTLAAAAALAAAPGKHHAAVDAAGAADGDAAAELGGLDDFMKSIIEQGIRSFLSGFEDKTSSELLDRAHDNLKLVVAASSEDAYIVEQVTPAVEALYWKKAGKSLFKAAKAMDKMKAPDVATGGGFADMFGGLETAAGESSIASRRLLGGDGDKSAMEYATEFGSKLNVTSTEMMQLFPKLTQNVKGVLETIVGKGEDASPQELLMLSALDLSAVAGRAAPVPFGKGSDEVFKGAWSTLMMILPVCTVSTLEEMLNGSAEA